MLSEAALSAGCFDVCMTGTFPHHQRFSSHKASIKRWKLTSSRSRNNRAGGQYFTSGSNVRKIQNFAQTCLLPEVPLFLQQHPVQTPKIRFCSELLRTSAWLWILSLVTVTKGLMSHDTNTVHAATRPVPFFRWFSRETLVCRNLRCVT